MKLNRHTTKLFYRDPYLAACETTVVKIDADWVELADTVAYPEGGGQDPDQGRLCLSDGTALRFVHAKKMYGHAAGLPGFPDIQVEGIVLHRVHADDQHLLERLVPGARVTVSIDVKRRAALSLIHVLLRREGWQLDRNQAYRLYCEERLPLRSKLPKRRKFETLGEAKAIVEAWRQDYNESRPHSALEALAPAEFARQRVLSVDPAGPETPQNSR